MHKQIYVNLPVRDLGRTKEFFTALGFSFNPQFSNEQGVCMVISENIFAMLLVESFFQTFTNKPVADASTSTEVLVCLSCDSRAEVDELVAKALAAGGRAPHRCRTTASCMATASKTSTATCGNWRTWIPTPRRLPSDASGS